MSVGRASLALSLAVCAGCVGHAGSSSHPPYDDLPSFSMLVHERETLVSIVIDIDCAGIWGVQRLSDGWTTSAVAHGESYTLTLTPPQGETVSGFESGPPQLAWSSRGQWSDCFSIKLTANVDADGQTKSRVFVPQDHFDGPWISVEAYEFAEAWHWLEEAQRSRGQPFAPEGPGREKVLGYREFKRKDGQWDLGYFFYETSTEAERRAYIEYRAHKICGGDFRYLEQSMKKVNEKVSPPFLPGAGIDAEGKRTYLDVDLEVECGKPG